MKVARFSPRYMDSFPRPLEDGVLYISRKFGMAAHNCACGCGQEVMTPLKPTQWRLTVSAQGAVTLYPSIGNWSFPCRSHYWIRANAVVWSYQMSEGEIQRNRRLDRTAREAYYRSQDRDEPRVPNAVGPKNPGVVDAAVAALKNLWDALFRR